ncbi:HlyD family secretion protein [Erwiniaceae bacterium BAC15a-03b]|uniref:HlyD family secretion protein n=1 Tax=Winslowiella arboricola TaxID=2978220 RepID=A0A9J6PVE0_9GAMM|nr:HlyD family secretion protein [Winslowiella arboricola]MCU5775497.1 HlyD family secretion protein [Winslowiella arboricola]MCU5779653.1 HlyD family secretion protein [Winslowiella arboricola]
MSEVNQQRQKRRVFTLFALLILAAALLLVGWWWFFLRAVESTDDAFIDGHLSQISAQIAGRVERIAVEDNQMVKRGDLLIELDPRDRQIALDKALAARSITQAKIGQSVAELTALEASLGQVEANVQLAEAEYQRDEKQYLRYRQSGSAVSHSELDAKAASAKTSAATLLAQRKNISYSKAQLLKARAALVENQATLQQDDAEIASARLLLSYTRITAPGDGYVTKRTAEAGNTVSAGSVLMVVIDSHVWVTANFKENQLAAMRPGQRVEVRVDAWPRQRFKARVDSIQRATGSVFSLLPAENATGNYVKIVQRVPVKIVFTDADIAHYALSPGMSVVPYVNVKP